MEIDKINVTQITETLDKGTVFIQDTLPVVERILDMRRECELARLHTECVKFENQAQIVRIIAKFHSNKDAMEKVFGERERSLGKFYEVMDKALESGDRELLLQAMQQISKIVTSSPLEAIERMSRNYDDDSQTLLDF